MSEQISIIDVTLACLVSWLEGHSLAQTVFTNLYFQKPYEIEDPSLKAFCICIYKIIDAIRDFANRLVNLNLKLIFFTYFSFDFYILYNTGHKFLKKKIFNLHFITIIILMKFLTSELLV